MKGILKIAYKLLVNDKGKFAALLVGITFAVFLMVMMTSMFAGILPGPLHSRKHRSKVSVMDPAVDVASSIPMPRSVGRGTEHDEADYAVPLYSRAPALSNLRHSVYQAATSSVLMMRVCLADLNPQGILKNITMEFYLLW